MRIIIRDRLKFEFSLKLLTFPTVTKIRTSQKTPPNLIITFLDIKLVPERYLNMLNIAGLSTFYYT